jgi:DNA-binding transcriptional LysR family regulator
MPRMPAPSADDIATFVAVVRGQSLSSAGRKLGLPKSTVSRRLMRLEQDVRVKLLHRDARKVTLTPAGRRFFDAVAGAVDSIDTALSSLDQTSKAPRGSLRITAPIDLGRMVLAPILVAFLERYPEISVDVAFTNRMVDLVAEGFDLAVRAGKQGAGSLIARPLCESELQLAVASGRAAEFQDEDVRSLERQAFVLHQAARYTQTVSLQRQQGKRGKGVELHVHGRLNVDDYAALAELVAAGHGVGLLPAVHVRDGLQHKRLARIYPEWSVRAQPIYLAYPARQQPERARLLGEYLLGAFGQIGQV